MRQNIDITAPQLVEQASGTIDTYIGASPAMLGVSPDTRAIATMLYAHACAMDFLACAILKAADSRAASEEAVGANFHALFKDLIWYVADYVKHQPKRDV